MYLRAHHIFCIQGFKGKGYSEEFVSNMKKVIEYLNHDRDTFVKILNTPDHICLGCPNNVGVSKLIEFEIGKIYEVRGNCENERYIKNLDDSVIEVLNIEANKEYSYNELLDKIKEKLTFEKFERICGDCQWYSLGYCKEGLLSKD